MTVSKDEVRSIFAKLAGDDPQEFFEHVADNVQWCVLGTHPLAGRYNSKREFQEATFAKLSKFFDVPLKLFTRDVLVNGDKAAVELFTRATSKSGTVFNNEYCWICRFSGNQIVKVRAYLDSALVAEVIEQASPEISTRAA
jgi:hypothetical protein